MELLKVKLENCYGINKLEMEFDFRAGGLGNKNKAYAIYAPNGLMKSSFAKTFDVISSGKKPEEERYNRPASFTIEVDGVSIDKNEIYVLRSKLDISSDSQAITDILVDPGSKSRYDKLVVELDNQKDKIKTALQKSSRVKKNDVESRLLADLEGTDFTACIREVYSSKADEDLSPYVYNIIFDSKALDVLKSAEFLNNATEFNARYNELFTKSGTIYKKGVFNPARADISFATLEKQGFFGGGHRVHLNGDEGSITKIELDHRVSVVNASIDGDEQLKKIRTNLAKNAQTLALTELIEALSSTQVEYLLDRVKLENQDQFRRELWAYYIHEISEVETYLKLVESGSAEILAIERGAAQNIPLWTQAIELFNERFIDMPFALSVENSAQAVLGKETAKLKFTFKDNGEETVEWNRSELKTLSQGEERALYILNFIFEVEARKLATQKTLFIIDDVADSFDYKNKHAIVQYIEDLNKVDFFYQIILTHNFDFYRTLAISNVVHRERCLMTIRNLDSIELTKAEGVKNYFIGVWKNKVEQCEKILCATIPFSRNLLEYTRDSQDGDYRTLSSLLHWKRDTESISIGQYFDIYNRLFQKKCDTSNVASIASLIFSLADSICEQTTHNGLNLEDKVLLSIAIRLCSEKYIIGRLRELKGDPEYWCVDSNQFGTLMTEYSSLGSTEPAFRLLQNVSITVSSNIHLNSFMYEPILDLNIEHLIALYLKVKAL